MIIKSTCPSCKKEVNGIFPVECTNCGFSVLSLAGSPSSAFQTRKWNEHADIVQGRNIGLYGKPYNASFDHNGTAVLEDLVRFTITFGDKATLTSRGGRVNEVIVSYIPEPIGAGTALYTAGTVTCSGIAIISPSSIYYGHSFPIMNEWVTNEFGTISSSCKICGTPTSFAQPICGNCYLTDVKNWQDLFSHS